jgi:hypothetical protein
LQPNPFLKKLGFAATDRLVIIHADDIGMCQASVAAFSELVDFGLVSSGAVMVPCPWFLFAAEYCREHPAVDVGVHLTLNCEWETYRWGPLSTHDPASGLLDEQGYFHRDPAATQALADPAVVLLELQAQLQRALQAGIAVTHVDTHMFTLAHPKFIPAYVQLALQHRLPMLFPRQVEAGYRYLGLDAESAATAAQFARQLEEMGLPLMDCITGIPLAQPDERLEQAKKFFAELPAGITHFVLHPSIDTPELRAIAPDWRSRVGDYQTFGSEALRGYLRDQGIQVIGYRALQESMVA